VAQAEVQEQAATRAEELEPDATQAEALESLDGSAVSDAPAVWQAGSAALQAGSEASRACSEASPHDSVV